MGKPVVLGDSDANRELFKQDSKTMFVPRGNSNELKKCIERVYIRKMEENDAE